MPRRVRRESPAALGLELRMLLANALETGDFAAARKCIDMMEKTYTPGSDLSEVRDLVRKGSRR